MESLFRRDVYIDMMLRQIYLAFGVLVKIDPKDVKADQVGNVTFNCDSVLKVLDVSLDEFNARLKAISVIYRRVDPKEKQE